MALGRTLGKTIAPWRFILFGAILIAACAGLVPLAGWRHGIMAAFDLAALTFLATLPALIRLNANDMRQKATENDANRAALLIISVAVNLVVLVAVGTELADKGGSRPLSVALIVGTLLLAWLFANMVYALHYAHIFYLKRDGDRGDRGGLRFPDIEEPGYWEFIYFSFTLGMTFQTSDVEITTTQMRIVSIIHAFAAFVFNLGVVAFTINILGSGS
ncbi:DUF1345 domain-containing protein [Sphingomonas sp. S2-65]|uniref:DUF1345 domain-containing protein n=1 Tax=Sphingomonas sp. S2-65 TaxID=2903960 RepID=UPI001F337B59|nr:DUF1345 domain-containing protein [Sphingomonas sp. S2-65]UYY59485.1 DUF1345 domain-containing protein [Sphingomonas sp. S2-65]